MAKKYSKKFQPPAVAWRTSVADDRQTDRQTTDGFAIAKSRRKVTSGKIESCKTRMRNATRKVSKRSGIRIWQWRRAEW